MTDILAE